MLNKNIAKSCQICTSREKSVFCDLSKDHLMELDEAKTTNGYRPRQTIFYEGNQPYGLYCIASGKVKIFKMDPQGHQQIVRLAGSGDILGYRCLLAQEPYSATAETLEETQICFINKKTFFHVLETHPATALQVFSVLARELGKSEAKLVDLVHKNVRERLAGLLLVFHGKYGTKTKEGSQLGISLSREEMAELIGTTPESVIRMMTEFKQERLIAVEGRKITLLNIKKLSEEADPNQL